MSALLETLNAAVRFTLDDGQRAADDWGANCGPGALAAALDKTLDEVRPFLGDFETKRYTNPTLMLDSLRRLGVAWRLTTDPWPRRGLVRIQWEGPWTAAGVPIRVRYRQTHWVAAASVDGEVAIFDINCLCVGGWVSLQEWSVRVVPWLLRECVPKANGKWHSTHRLELPELHDGAP